jgi:hypothetical protein
MKRGLITWNKSEIPPAVFDKRVETVRQVLTKRNLAALVVYSELWRSNQARFFSNFMPYFNRALLIIPREMPPILLCGLSPRVYGWIRSVTTIEDVRPAGNFAKPLFDIATERNWMQLGCLDFDQFPYDLQKNLRSGSLQLTNAESSAVFQPEVDENERSMRRSIAGLVREALEEELPKGVGLTDHEFVGILERRFRKAGAEDLIVLITNGKTVPASPTGATLEQNFSVSIALEYRGHWVRITRPHGVEKPVLPPDAILIERMDGSYPYELASGSITATHLEFSFNGKRLFFGDTTL